MFQRSRTSKPRLAALASIAGGLAGGVAAVTRRRAKAGAAPDARQGGPAGWTCDCGQEFRVSGQGRHRVYWLKDADPGDPVVGGRCPNCERPLPGEHVVDEESDEQSDEKSDAQETKEEPA